LEHRQVPGETLPTVTAVEALCRDTRKSVTTRAWTPNLSHTSSECKALAIGKRVETSELVAACAMQLECRK
jgi:hypothetical protein